VQSRDTAAAARSRDSALPNHGSTVHRVRASPVVMVGRPGSRRQCIGHLSSAPFSAQFGQGNFSLELPCWRESGSRHEAAWILAKTTFFARRMR